MKRSNILSLRNSSKLKLLNIIDNNSGKRSAILLRRLNSLEFRENHARYEDQLFRMGSCCTLGLLRDIIPTSEIIIDVDVEDILSVRNSDVRMISIKHLSKTFSERDHVEIEIPLSPEVTFFTEELDTDEDSAKLLVELL